MRIRFHFRPIPLIATVLLICLGVSLGQWQIRRAHEKQRIESRMTQRVTAPIVPLGATPVSADALEYRRVAVHGHFVRDWPVYLDNRPQDGRPGLYVVMPFQIAGSAMHVLVERGWLPLNLADRSKLLPYPTPAGEIELAGIARRHAGHVMQLGAANALKPGAIVQNLALADFARASGMTLQPILIEQTSANDSKDGLVRDWPKPSSGIERHQGYAFQWYALALMAFVFFVATGFRREPS